VNENTFLALAGASLTLFRFFRRMGVFGIFLFSVLDSSFLVLPFGNDLLLIGLTSSDKSYIGWVSYVVAAAVGSVLGVLLVDFPARAAGEKGLRRFVRERTLSELKTKMAKRAGATILITSLLPPPFPFTPVMMTASAFQYPRVKLLGNVFVGRLIRYTIEGILALYFGRKLIRYINSDWFGYVVYGLIAIAVVASVISALKWFSKRRTEVVGSPA
jgi:membrane protein YqaA with SNARE-associated domain